MSEYKYPLRMNLSMMLLTIFIILKLTGNIDWSWWWVTSPLWLPYALFIVLAFFILIIGVIGSIFNATCEFFKQ